VEAQSFFVIRSKRKMCFQRTSSRVVDKATGLRSDQIGDSDQAEQQSEGKANRIPA
jgi:hypothetical protein